MIQAWIEIERHNTAMKGCRGCRKGTEHTARCDACQKEKSRFWSTQPAYVGHETKGGELVSGALVRLMQDA
jgi:hypothetical protein